jgi:hypothetical protein
LVVAAPEGHTLAEPAYEAQVAVGTGDSAVVFAGLTVLIALTRNSPASDRLPPTIVGTAPPQEAATSSPHGGSKAMFNQLRARTALLIAAVVAAALLAPGGTTAQAQSAPVAATTQSAAAERPVLTSEFGTARSRVYGTYGRNGTVRGWFVPRHFDNRSGKLVAIGRLHAILKRADGSVRGTTNERIVIPVKRVEGVRPGARQLATCDILNLVLGPLDLNLLGLEVHLNRVILDIVAVTGAGNLLGNLLCAVAGLLDNSGVLRQISQILNSILAILRL